MGAIPGFDLIEDHHDMIGFINLIESSRHGF